MVILKEQWGREGREDHSGERQKERERRKEVKGKDEEEKRERREEARVGDRYYYTLHGSTIG